MNMTLGYIPKDATMLAKTGLPFGVTCHPIADGKTLPLVTFGEEGVVRCKSCRAYMNPFVKFLDGGRRWKCNFCFKINDVHAAYFAPTDADGVRVDAAQRPELSQGSVEFTAPVEYMVRPPTPPVYVFVLDVSYNAVSSGILKHACDAIRAALPNLPGGDRTLIGFITHDSAVHFYAFKRSANGEGTVAPPRVLVVSDIDDLFVPLPEDLLVNLSEHRASIDSLVGSLPNLYAGTRVMDSALGPALTAAFAISQHIGGKVVAVQAALPSVGPGKLKPREGPRMLGGDKEKDLLAPDTSPDATFYKDRAIEFSRQQLSVDFFLFNPNYADVATLGALSRYTAGQVYWYGNPYNPISDGARFAADVVRDLTRTTGFEAVMRVRATRGISITNFFGNFFIRGTDLLTLPNVTADTAFNVELAFDAAAAAEVVPGGVVSVQAALLYTTSGGERRIAVHTLARSVTAVIADLFKNVDIDAVVNMMAKIALDNTLREGLPKARARLHKTVVDIMRAYREVSLGGGSGGGHLGHAAGGAMSRMPGVGMGAGGGGGGQAGPKLPECLALLPLVRSPTSRARTRT